MTYDEVKRIKDFADLCEEIRKLQFFYYNCDFNSMMHHIFYLHIKYALEFDVWNLVTSRYADCTYDFEFQNAYAFLQAKKVALMCKITN